MKTLLTLFLLVASSTWAIQLQDIKPFEYKVLFTNPECKTYYYNDYVVSNNGEELTSKPKNAYCKSGDSRRNEYRDGAPHKELLDIIRDPNTKELFLAYLSFSKTSIANELCRAIEQRNVKVTLIYDSNNASEPSRRAKGDMLSKCRPKNLNNDETPNLPTVMFGGNVGSGSNKIGYAHNKLIMVNPSSTEGAVKLVYSSGNMSSGTTTHHENWHFVTTNADSYFFKAHQCLKEGMINHGTGKKAFSSFIKSCRAKITNEKETDISVFFVPAEGNEAMKSIKDAIKKSKSVDLAAHRFSNGQLISALDRALNYGTEMRLISDDDMYWSGFYGQGMGRNMIFEWYRVEKLMKKGMKSQYVQTYADDVWEPKRLQLQHNKFLIFTFKNDSGAVFAGAGNLTTAAFKTNYENFYYITIPSVVEAFNTQYKFMWDELSTSAENMPTELVLP